jgi:hypothetical protein
MADSATLPEGDSQLAKYRTFGERGPLYEILGPGSVKGTLAIRVVHTGEEADYPLDQALEDPEAS